MLTASNKSINRFVLRTSLTYKTTIPKIACSPITYKISFFGFFIRRAFTVCTENNLYNELNNIRRSAHIDCFKVQHINKLIMDIAKNRKAKHKFDSQKTFVLLFNIS